VTNPPATAGSGTATVDLGLQTSGVVSGYRITVQAQYGSATVEQTAATADESQSVPGDGQSVGVRYTLRYTPNAGFMGVDTVTLVAFGPGGESQPAVFTFNVPGKAPDLTGTVASNGSVSFSPTNALTGGPFQGLRITRQPGFGQAMVNGTTLTFTPGLTNGGAVTIDYVVVLAFGESQAGQITVTSNLVPAPQALSATTLQGVPVTVRISDNVQGGPFTAASVVSVTQSSSGTAAITTNGSGSTRTYDLTFTPSGAFQGQAVVAYSLSNAVAAAEGTLIVTVRPRPDPALDVEVRGVTSTQVISARRFADTQMDNIQRRLESLHDGDNESSNALGLNLHLGQHEAARDPRQTLRHQFGTERNDLGGLADRDHEQLRAVLAHQIWGNRVDSDGSIMPAGDDRREVDGSRSSPRFATGGLPSGLWATGSVDWGRTDAQGQRDFRFSTQGITVGLDKRFTDQLILGAGLGYAQDRTKIGDSGSLTRGRSLTGALYASYRPMDGYHVDGLIGYGELDFSSRRWTSGLNGEASTYAVGERSGDLLFTSVSVGQTLVTSEARRTFYVRLQARRIGLDAFSETGAGLSSLSWSPLTQESVSAALGGSWTWTYDLRERGMFIPSLRLEWTHELEGATDQSVRYADWAASPYYLVPVEGWLRDQLRLEGGLEWRLGQTLLGLGYRAAFGDRTVSQGADLRIRLQW